MGARTANSSFVPMRSRSESQRALTCVVLADLHQPLSVQLTARVISADFDPTRRGADVLPATPDREAWAVLAPYGQADPPTIEVHETAAFLLPSTTVGTRSRLLVRQRVDEGRARLRGCGLVRSRPATTVASHRGHGNRSRQGERGKLPTVAIRGGLQGLRSEVEEPVVHVGS
jgi:hypothetical protein